MRTAEHSYGSDQQGLIWGYRFPPGRPAEPVTSAAAARLLESPGSCPAGEFVWLHFSLANTASESWLRQNLRLPDGFFESLHGEVGSTRLEQTEDSLVAVIHDVMFDFKFDAGAVATACICIETRFLISARRSPLRSVDELRAAVRAGQVFRSPVELLAHLLRDQANVLMNILRESTRRVDQIEDRLLANRVSTSRTELGSLRRVLVRLQRLLAPEPAALFRLLNRPPEWIDEDDVRDLRQSAEEFAEAVGDSRALVERVELLQQELGAQVNEQTNRTLFVLTAVTVLALPINMVAGLFGMNVGGIPLAEHLHGFFFIAGLLVALTALLVYLVFGRRRD
jgi:zinc transporter